MNANCLESRDNRRGTVLKGTSTYLQRYLSLQRDLGFELYVCESLHHLARELRQRVTIP